MVTRLLTLPVLTLTALVAAGEPTSVQLESRITGSRESPRVTYILPWRQPAGPEADWQPAQTIAGDLFKPLDRDEYRRQLYYQSALGAPEQPASAASNTDKGQRGN